MDIDTTLKLKEIDQLDAAILQFSKNTMQSKKLCASLLVAIIGIILKITDNKLDNAIYVSGTITVLIFWIIDAKAYYFQRKLRIRMTEIVKSLQTNGISINGYGMPISRNKPLSWYKAFFNSSQYFYLFAIVAIVAVFVVDILGGI
ncbi:hypothetical protein EYV94_26040 [Puteibacter caeruleilacunae]|nr:hypothetical protein EYV94_26040 [Puteibacter caeruleilacunae]